MSSSYSDRVWSEIEAACLVDPVKTDRKPGSADVVSTSCGPRSELLVVAGDARVNHPTDIVDGECSPGETFRSCGNRNVHDSSQVAVYTKSQLASARLPVVPLNQTPALTAASMVTP